MYAAIAGEPQTALDTVKKYLVTAGKKGEFYKAALSLLNKAEQAEQIIPLEREMVVIPAGSFLMGCVSGHGCYSHFEPGYSGVMSCLCIGGQINTRGLFVDKETVESDALELPSSIYIEE